MGDPKPFHYILKVAAMLSSLDKPWYVAGGWAIDLYLGEQIFKARHVAIEDPYDMVHPGKDEEDFQAVRRSLTAEQRAWLTEALTLFYSNHPWLKYLAEG
jgi:hypothetical protein